MGRPEWVGSADKRWRPARGGAVQVDGLSATRREMGEEEAGEYKEREAASTGER